ncbi:putative short-chain type dehydrogenase/reductase [Pseudonocardia sulfidoxydans NBRC 16205]|uniref:Putative short-chain type dehydrogenase/reductase n=1 Tax=Pseudonocardia sulfidoxydans NBRC 16205 TaxID=1223511 RepID=A0A511DG03_9PSEU|nr:mycofactocin-coupled SDR family oxidoreductase [Pseudonocardia sulfidoxydans]GEL23710.1 putative short-chain type dehydrogenase/reductase [Pseudonocardia sulfidoxydans NBRC 16205]
MGRFEGKVALVTGAARGQGRSHALAMAREGAQIIAVDINKQIDTVPYPMATPADLAETARLVEDLDRRVLAREADCADADAMAAIIEEGLSEFGRIDVIAANAGIAATHSAVDMPRQAWHDQLSTNLTGVWFSIQPALPAMIASGNGGSIVITSSLYGVSAPPANLAHYVAAKHGVVGLMRALANELAPHNIRVNTVNPTYVHTDMVENDAFYAAFNPDAPTRENFLSTLRELNKLPVSWMDPTDITNAVLYLASDDSRYVTGHTLMVDCGASV